MSAKSLQERAQILSDPLVQKWLVCLRKGSEKTATMWSSGLWIFCHSTRLTPAKLAELDPHALQETGERFEKTEVARGVKGSTIATRLGMVRNFYQFTTRRVLPHSTFKVEGANDSKEEAALTREQLHTALESANLRERVIIALMAMSGLRPGVIGNFDGADGLTLGDLPDLNVGALEFRAEVGIVQVRKELSKAGHAYVTHIGDRGQGVVVSYLRSRVAKGEKLTEASPLLMTDGGRFPRSSEVGDYVRSSEGGRPTLLPKNHVRDSPQRGGSRWTRGPRVPAPLGRPYGRRLRDLQRESGEAQRQDTRSESGSLRSM
ncbi:MAG: hypothetical protein WBS16_07615 [Thermoplasmata archaeon]